MRNLVESCALFHASPTRSIAHSTRDCKIPHPSSGLFLPVSPDPMIVYKKDKYFCPKVLGGSCSPIGPSETSFFRHRQFRPLRRSARSPPHRGFVAQELIMRRIDSQRPKLPDRREALRLSWLGNPAAKPRSRATVRSRVAIVTLDGRESGGNRTLSADAVAFCLRVFLHLAPCERRLDLTRWGYGCTARFHRRSVRNVARQLLGKLALVVRVELRIVAAPR
jgi:hypothetical protein